MRKQKRRAERTKKIYGKTILKEFRFILRRFIELIKKGVIEGVEVFKGYRLETEIPVEKKLDITPHNGRILLVRVEEGFHCQTFRVVTSRQELVKKLLVA